MFTLVPSSATTTESVTQQQPSGSLLLPSEDTPTTSTNRENICGKNFALQAVVGASHSGCVGNYPLSCLNRDDGNKQRNHSLREDAINYTGNRSIPPPTTNASESYSQSRCRTNGNRSTIVKNIIILNEGIRIIDPLLSRNPVVVPDEGLRPLGNMVRLGRGTGAFSLVQKETDSCSLKECNIDSSLKKYSSPTEEEARLINQSVASIGLTDISTDQQQQKVKDGLSMQKNENLVNHSNPIVTPACSSPNTKNQKISLHSLINEFPESPRNSKLVFKANRFNTTIVQQISRRPSKTIFSTTLSNVGPLSSSPLGRVCKSTSPKKGIGKIIPGVVNRAPNFKIRKITAPGSLSRSDNLKKVYQF